MDSHWMSQSVEKPAIIFGNTLQDRYAGYPFSWNQGQRYDDGHIQGVAYTPELMQPLQQNVITKSPRTPNNAKESLVTTAPVPFELRESDQMGPGLTQLNTDDHDEINLRNYSYLAYFVSLCCCALCGAFAALFACKYNVDDNHSRGRNRQKINK